jgi:ABC-type transport system substrate-binding protein
MEKTVLWFLVLLITVVGLAACGGSGPSTDEPVAPAATDVSPADVSPTLPPFVGTLTVGLSADAESMDPLYVNQAAGWSVVQAVFDHLIDRDFEGNLVPGLALSWTAVGTLTLEFELHQGVTFHNGEPFNAESVKFSVDRILAEEEAPNRSKFTAIESVEIVDDYTVRFLLNQPDGTLFDSLTSRLAMLPPEYFQEVGVEGFAAVPVGGAPGWIEPLAHHAAPRRRRRERNSKRPIPVSRGRDSHTDR